MVATEFNRAPMDTITSDSETLDDFEESDTISLCDLPLHTDESQYQNYCHSPSESSLFEFFSDFAADMCPADELIISGRLTPFKQDKPSKKTVVIEQAQSPIMLRIRSESDSQRSRSKSSKAHIMRTSRSLDDRKTPPPAGKDRDLVRKVSLSSVQSKSPWCMFFGVAKIPPEMDIRDIKSRQIRRNQPVSVAGDKVFARRTTGKGSWGLLRALSCNSDGTAAVTSSLECMHR